MNQIENDLQQIANDLFQRNTTPVSEQDLNETEEVDFLPDLLPSDFMKKFKK